MKSSQNQPELDQTHELMEPTPPNHIPEPKYFDVNLDKLEERPDGSRRENHDRGVVICRDIKEVQAMFESNNIIKGQKVTSQIEKEEEEREKEAEVKIFKVPSEVYQDFEELDEANEDMFEVVSYSLIIQFLEHICLKIK